MTRPSDEASSETALSALSALSWSNAVALAEHQKARVHLVMRFASLGLVIAMPALVGAQALSTRVGALVTSRDAPAATAWMRDSGTTLVARFLQHRRRAW